MTDPAIHTRQQKRKILAWALYDWGNSAFATSVMAGFFPLFLGSYWIGENSDVDSTFVLGLTNGLANLVIVLMAPLLGAIADRGGVRKAYLARFAFLGCLMTGLLFPLSQGQWQWAVVLYAMGIVGFSGSMVFYDALLVNVAEREQRSRVSAFGFALGYLGGGLLFAVHVAMVSKPEWFGLPDTATAVRVAFLTVALWWAAFTIPLLRKVPEPPATPGEGKGILAGFREVATTFREIRKYKTVFTFLIAYWLYIDGVDTVVRMAVDFGQRLGFSSNDLILALLLVQFVGFPATWLYGHLGQRIGARSGIFIGISIYALIVIAAQFIEQTWHFYAIAVAIGLVQGGVQSLSRALYSQLIPPERSAEFFGFYNMLGKFAAVIGPIMVGWVSVLSGSPRIAMLSLLILFVGGALVLTRVPRQIDSQHPPSP